jgi:hypothetical protein
MGLLGALNKMSISIAASRLAMITNMYECRLITLEVAQSLIGLYPNDKTMKEWTVLCGPKSPTIELEYVSEELP